MSFKVAGIKELYTAPGSAAFPSDGTGAIGAGFRGKAKLKISPFNAVKNEKFNVEFQRLQNVNIEVPCNQMALIDLKAYFGYALASDASLAVVTSGVVKSTDITASGGLLTFDNLNSLGCDIELTLSPKDAEIKLTFERAFDVDTMASLLAASTTNSISSTLVLPHLVSTSLPVKGQTGLKLGAASAIASEQIADWKVIVKSRSTKTALNKSIVSGFDVTVETTFANLDITTIAANVITQFLSSDVSVIIPIASNYNLTFKKEALVGNGEFDLDDDKRELKLTFTGFYDAEFVDLSDSSNIIFKALL